MSISYSLVYTQVSWWIFDRMKPRGHGNRRFVGAITKRQRFPSNLSQSIWPDLIYRTYVAGETHSDDFTRWKSVDRPRPSLSMRFSTFLLFFFIATPLRKRVFIRASRACSLKHFRFPILEIFEPFRNLSCETIDDNSSTLFLFEYILNFYFFIILEFF